MDEKICLQQRVKNFCAQLLLTPPFGRGKKVWLRLNEKLPEAVGAKINDEPRIKQFKEDVKRLSFLDLYALKKWLQYKYDKLKDDWDETEHFTGSFEQHCTKWLQIYEEHLAVL